MPLFLKTVRSVQILPATSALECSKLMKVGIFLELDTLDLCPVHFGIIEGLVTSLFQASKLVYSGGYLPTLKWIIALAYTTQAG